SFLELIDAATGIDELLSPREEGMALAADIDLHYVHVLRGARLERLAACADDGHLMIVGMNVRLHSSFTSLINGKYGFYYSPFPAVRQLIFHALAVFSLRGETIFARLTGRFFRQKPQKRRFFCRKSPIRAPSREFCTK